MKKYIIIILTVFGVSAIGYFIFGRGGKLNCDFVVVEKRD